MLLFLFLIFPLSSQADPISGLLFLIEKIQGYQQQVAGIQQSIEGLTQDIQNAVSGQSEWGDWRFKDYASWGNKSDRWNAVLNIAENGGNKSPLGRTLRSIAQAFPLDTVLYNRVNPNPTDQKYYALKSKTALVARAASQLSYDNIQEQIDYANQLRQQIGSTTTLKQSLDLQNRLTIENTLIQLETLRQLALLNQQHAIDAQVQVNEAIQTARFLGQSLSNKRRF